MSGEGGPQDAEDRGCSCACKLLESIDPGHLLEDGGKGTGHAGFPEESGVAWTDRDSEQALI